MTTSRGGRPRTGITRPFIYALCVNARERDFIIRKGGSNWARTRLFPWIKIKRHKGAKA